MLNTLACLSKTKVKSPHNSYQPPWFPCTYSQESKGSTPPQLLTASQVPVQRLARGVTWTEVLFKSYLHTQPIIDPLPSFMMCRFNVSTYPVSFSLSISHRSMQSTSLINSIPSNNFVVTGISWYNLSFKIIR